MSAAEIKPMELTAPAGNLQKLKVAIAYGADAVYMSAPGLSLRAPSADFSAEALAEAIEYAHLSETRAIVLLNALPHNEHIEQMRRALEWIAPLKPDALVVSDPGAFEVAQEGAPGVPIHISTQANVTNLRTAKFWERMGASRIILARELSLREIEEIASGLDIGVEIFVHGAMCMAYSGRCFMSKHIVGRDSNLGDCAQPCRWTYSVTEETRPGEIIPIEQGPEGTNIFSPRDLCMIEHLPEVIASGVCALKIEGRMKSAYYVGIATRAYRKALDCHASDPAAYTTDPAWLADLQTTGNRGFSTGFYLGDMQQGLTPAGGAVHKSAHAFVGLVVEGDSDQEESGQEDSGQEESGENFVEVRGRIRKGDELECVRPDGGDFDYAVDSILDVDGNPLDVAQPNQLVRLPGLDAPPYSLLRRRE